jgi:hypothetical protein
MHQIQLNDQLFEEARRRADDAGFPSVDEYIAEVLQQGFAGEAESFEHLFTPERLAHIDRAIASMDAGRGLTMEQVEAELAQRRTEWLARNRS